MKKKAVVAGQICIDITPVFPEETRRVGSLGEILLPGKLVSIGKPDIHTGGAVANTGLGMKALGVDTRLVGKVGNDEFGRMVKGILDESGAGDDLMMDSDSITSYTIVLAAPGIDRIFLHCSGANDSFTGEEVSDEILDGAALFHFGYPTVMRQMYAEDGRNLEALFSHVSSMGIATSLDMAAVDKDSEAGEADWEKILERTLPFVDFFVPSFEELCFMLDRPRFERLQVMSRAAGGDVTKAMDIDSDVRPLAEKCLAMGAKAVLLKCGAPGMFLETSGSMEKAGSRIDLDTEEWNDFCAFERSYRIKKVLSGTGAGDTSIAAFLTSILEGYGPREALQNAVAEGALCCTAYDAISGLKNLDEIRSMISSGWSKA